MSRSNVRHNEWHREWRKKNLNRARAIGRKAYNSVKASTYYQSKKEYIKSRGLAYRERVRLDVLSHYGLNGEPKCVCCGLDNPLVLTLDHKLGGGNQHRREIGKGRKTFSGYQFYLWLKRQGFPPLPLQTMCYNCNCGRWRNGGACPLHS